MIKALKQTAIVKPGGLVEIRSPELPDGATVEAIALLESISDELAPSLSSLIGSAKGSLATP